jgi:hypothetical protein
MQSELRLYLLYGSSAYPDISKSNFEISKLDFELFAALRAVHVRAPPSAPQVLPSYSLPPRDPYQICGGFWS